MQQRTWALAAVGLLAAIGIVIALRGRTAEASHGIEPGDVARTQDGSRASFKPAGDFAPSSPQATGLRSDPARSSVEIDALDPMGKASAGLRGVIESEDGGPCPNAVVQLAPQADLPTLTLRANNLGQFQGSNLVPGPYDLLVSADGHLPLASMLSLDPESDHNLGVLILRASRVLRGRVVNEQGRGIAGAELLRVQRPGPYDAVTLSAIGTSGPGGAFELAGLPRHPFSLAVATTDRPPVRVEVPAGLGDLEIVIPEGWSLPVRVVAIPADFPALRLLAYPATGSPPAAEERDWRLHTRRHWPLVGTDRVELHGLERGIEYDLELQANWKGDTWGACAPRVHVTPETLEAQVGPPQAKLQGFLDAPGMALEPTAASSILVRVEDPGGQPIAGVAVAVLAEPSGSETERFQIATGTSNLLGRARIEGIPPGDYALCQQHETPVGRRLMRGGSIAQVFLGSEESFTVAAQCTTIADEQSEVTLVVDPLFAIAGVVLDGGLPVAGASVHFLDSGIGLQSILAFADLGPPEATTGPEGRFRLSPAAGGDSTLVIEAAGRPIAHTESIFVGPDSANLVVRLPGGTLSGVVRSSTGEALYRAQVRVQVRGEDGSYVQAPKTLLVDGAGALSLAEPDLTAGQVLTGPGGEYTIKGIPPHCMLHLEVQAAGHIMGVDEVITQPGADHELDFILEAGGRLTVRVVDSGGALVLNSRAKLVWLGDGEQDSMDQLAGPGTCTFDDLRPGPWELTAEQHNGERNSTPQVINIQSGDTQQAEVLVP